MKSNKCKLAEIIALQLLTDLKEMVKMKKESQQMFKEIKKWEREKKRKRQLQTL